MAKSTWTLAEGNKPKTAGKKDAVVYYSDTLLLKVGTEKKNTVGAYMEHAKDWNGNKKGDGVFIDTKGNIIEGVAWYLPISQIPFEAPANEPKD